MLEKKKQLFIYSAGCLANFALAIIYAAINATEFSLLNVCLAVINLLPISCLDGGKILSVIFDTKEKMLNAISFSVTVAVLLIVFVEAFVFSNTHNSSLVLTSFVFIISLILN